MEYKKENRRKYLFGLIVLLAVATATTYAWTADETLTTDPTKVYVTSNPGTTSTISGYSSKPLGKNKIRIDFTVGAAQCDLEWMFITSAGEIQATTGTVKIDGGSALTADSNNVYSKTAVTAAAHYITIEGTGIWSDLDSGTGGSQTFNGIMFVIK